MFPLGFFDPHTEVKLPQLSGALDLSGGLAFGNVKATSPTFTGATETNAGWTVGAGLEVAITRNWTAKAEYLYVSLGDIKCGLNCGFQAVDNVNFHTHLLRGGLNYRF